MPFYLNVGTPRTDRRPADARGVAGEPGASGRGAFLRGLALGFASAFVVFDWLFTGGSLTHSAARSVQQMIGMRG
jgi:hypothetical protein